MEEKWIRWEPIKNLSKKYYLISILDDPEGFKVLLSDFYDEKKEVLITFEVSVDAYRDTNESFRLETMHRLGEQYGTKFYGDWTFFKVTNSEYLKWLSEQSFGIINSLEFIHFSLITANSILDIVTGYEPKVEHIIEK